MRVFVTGGSGFVGSRLLPRLASEGHEVTALALTPEDGAVLHDRGAAVRFGDLTGLDTLEPLLAEQDAIIHAAAFMDHWGEASRFDAVNITGTRNLLAASERAGVQRFVYVSAASVVLSLSPTKGDERLPVRSSGICHYSRSKAAAEQLVLAANRPGFSTVAIRPPMIWGAGDQATLPALAAAVRRGRFVLADGGRFRTSTCHVANVTDALVRALVADAHGRALFVTDGEPRANCDVLADLLATQGLELPRRSAPRWALVVGGWMLEMIWRTLRLSGKPLLTRSLVMLTSVDFTLDDWQARTLLGYQADWSWERGLEELKASSAVACSVSGG